MLVAAVEVLNLVQELAVQAVVVLVDIDLLFKALLEPMLLEVVEVEVRPIPLLVLVVMVVPVS
jgi:hypothetical protein